VQPFAGRAAAPLIPRSPTKFEDADRDQSVYFRKARARCAPIHQPLVGYRDPGRGTADSSEGATLCRDPRLVFFNVDRPNEYLGTFVGHARDLLAAHTPARLPLRIVALGWSRAGANLPYVGINAPYRRSDVSEQSVFGVSLVGRRRWTEQVTWSLYTRSFFSPCCKIGGRRSTGESGFNEISPKTRLRENW
jgi:hypothetical protein